MRLRYDVQSMQSILQNPLLHTRARRLTHGQYSGMNCAMDHCQLLLEKNNVPRAKGIFAHAKGFSSPLGWLLLTEEPDNFEYKAQSGTICVQIYVHPNHRRLGVGRKLLRKAAEHSDGLNLYCYSWSNRKFFADFMKRKNVFSL